MYDQTVDLSPHTIIRRRNVRHQAHGVAFCKIQPNNIGAIYNKTMRVS